MPPLTPARVTVASRIMLPTYVVFSALLGLNYVFAPEHRLKNPALTAARTVMPVEAWGLVFLILAAVMAVGMLSHNRTGVIIVLCYGAAMYFGWAIFYAASVMLDPRTSLFAPAWPLFVVTAHVASAASLMRGETQ